MTPRKNQFGIPGLTYDARDKVYIWRNKYAKEPVRFPESQYTIKQIERECSELNNIANLQAAIEKKQNQLPPTISQVIELFIADEVERLPWTGRTLTDNISMLRRYQREIGDKVMALTDRLYLGDWLDKLGVKADTYNGHLMMFYLLWDYAISKKIIEQNEARALKKRSTSAKVKGNQRDRQMFGRSLDESLEAFWKLYAAAPDWLQVGMELQLLTAQAKQETINMHRSHHRDGHLYVIRGKTAAQNDMAFIKIPVTQSLAKVIDRANRLEPICPYFVSTRPARRNPKQIASKPHQFYVTSDHYGKTFSKIRNELGLYGHLSSKERPGTHAIRKLGGQLMEAAGIKAQNYYGHSDERTSDIYLKNPDEIRDSHFREVEPGINLESYK